MAPPSSFLPLLIILVISLHHLLQVNSQHNSSFERTVLLSLNQHWGNSLTSLYENNSWKWNASSSHCDWPYVYCADHTWVTGLFLSSRGISGTIPSSIICQLKYLVSIDLSENNITGPLPACIRNCTSLQELNLSWNHISGAIPSSICQLQYLVTIRLSGNYLGGPIPACLRDCSSLQVLDLSGNQLSGTIPGELFLMKSLVTLSLNGNRLHGIIPTTIEKAVSLESLDLSNNHNLNGSIPYGITHLHNLRRLNLSVNSFSSEIPTRLFSNRGLQSLSLSNNNLSGPSLQILDLSGNQLSGTIPGELFLLESLVILSVNGNRLHGIIPTTIEKAVSLEILDLSANSFNGEIPTRLFSLHSLQSLSLSNNNLSGPILKIILGEMNETNILAWLTTVNLCGNAFSGKVPYEFWNEYFRGSCLDSSNLCFEKETTDESLPSCPSSLCSYRIFQGYEMCTAGYTHKKSYTHINSYDVTIIILGITAIGAMGFALIFCYFARKCKKYRKFRPSMKDEPEWKMFSFQGLKFETADILSSITDENLIGHGGSGKVYRVFTNLKMTYVAVKSISISRISDHRAEKEFLAEVHTLGATWHYNIIKLLCYISGPDMKLLVYEYFENKSLDRWLHGSNSVTKLDWPTRMNIAIGAAQGLCYMHHHCPIPIIHRDIKSSNILLDSEFNAKIADFGLAKLLNKCGDTETASAVAGTFGYIAPEYAYTSKVNAKSDVYSFGVVLLELTTGRKAVTRGEDVNLGGWAHLQCKDASATFDALDVSIKEATIYLDQIISVFRLGVVCTSASPSNRPSMKDCLHILQNCNNNDTTSSAC